MLRKFTVVAAMLAMLLMASLPVLAQQQEEDMGVGEAKAGSTTPPTTPPVHTCDTGAIQYSDYEVVFNEDYALQHPGEIRCD